MLLVSYLLDLSEDVLIFIWARVLQLQRVLPASVRAAVFTKMRSTSTIPPVDEIEIETNNLLLPDATECATQTPREDEEWPTFVTSVVPPQSELLGQQEEPTPPSEDTAPRDAMDMEMEMGMPMPMPISMPVPMLKPPPLVVVPPPVMTAVKMLSMPTSAEPETDEELAHRTETDDRAASDLPPHKPLASTERNHRESIDTADTDADLDEQGEPCSERHAAQEDLRQAWAAQAELDMQKAAAYVDSASEASDSDDGLVPSAEAARLPCLRGVDCVAIMHVATQP